MAANENIKGITIQIGGDVKPLEQALEEAKDKTKTLAQELDALNKKLKLDPNNIEDLKKKFSVLTKYIEESDKKVSDLQQAWQQAREDFKAGKISQTEFDRITQEMKSAEKENDILHGQLDTTKKKLEELGYEITDTGDIIEKVKDNTEDAGDAVEDLGDAAEDSADAIEDVGEATEEVGDNVEKIGKQTKNASGGMKDLSIASLAAAGGAIKLAQEIVEAAIKLRKYLDAQDELLVMNEKITKSIEKSKEAYKDQMYEIENQNISLSIQLNRIRELDKEVKDETKTEAEAKKKKDQLRAAVEQFNEAAGESVLAIDEETGALQGNIKAGTDFINNLKQRAQYQANYNRLVEIYTQITLLKAQNEQFAANVTDQHTDKYSRMIDKNNLAIKGLEKEALYLEGVVSGYLDYSTAATTAEESIEQLTDAEAEYLLKAQANGEVLSDLQQQQLEEYRANHQEEVKILDETIKEEQRLQDLRVQMSTDTNNKIELNTKNSLKKRAKTIEHNTKMINNYEKNLHELLLIALAQDDEDAKQAMLNYINTLTDYSEDSMSIVQMMVDDFGKKGGESAWRLINDFKEAQTPGEWSNVGIEIGKAAGSGVATGLDKSIPLVTNEATQMARAIEKQLKGVKVTYKMNNVTGIQRNGTTIQAMAQGGIVTKPTFTLTGEAGPEAIIPLDKLGGIIESALGNSGGTGGKYIMNVYPQSMSPSEQDMLFNKFNRMIGQQTGRAAI